VIYMNWSNLKLVRVSWLDTVEHPSGWYDKEDIEKLEDVALVHSYGLLLKQSKKSVTLIADFIPESKEFGRSTVIPKGMIEEIVDIFDPTN
jgi:hypothetical protein